MAEALPTNHFPDRPLTVAWFSYFGVEWLDRIPEELKGIPKEHPATWQSVLLGELEKVPNLHLHIIVLRKTFPRDIHFERHGVQFHCLKTPPGGRVPTLFWMDTLRIARQLRQIRPDLVHAWGTEYGAAMVAARLGYPNLVTMQGLFTWMNTLFDYPFYFRMLARIERWSLRRARHVSAESAFAVRFLKEHYPNLQLHPVEHAPNPLYATVERRPLLAPRRFVCVSSYGYEKGTDVLFEALQAVAGEIDFRLVFIGRGDEAFLSGLKARLPASLWERVEFQQNRTPAQIAEELARANLSLYPSRADNSPNAVKEAVIAGVPVVASDIGGIPDYVRPGRNGLLFPVGDADACANAIRQACADPLLGRGAVDEATLAEMRNYLSARTMGRKMLAAYAAVLRGD